MKVAYRLALPSNAATCVEIIRQWNDEHQWLGRLDGRSHMQNFWRRWFVSEFTWVAESKRRVWGFCVRNVGDENNIGGLYVVRGYRGRGIGKALLDRAKQDCDHLTVWAYEKNVEAMRFYLREGLVEISREFDAASGLVDVEHRWRRHGPGD